MYPTGYHPGEPIQRTPPMGLYLGDLLQGISSRETLQGTPQWDSLNEPPMGPPPGTNYRGAHPMDLLQGTLSSRPPPLYPNMGTPSGYLIQKTPAWDPLEDPPGDPHIESPPRESLQGTYRWDPNREPPGGRPTGNSLQRTPPVDPLHGTHYREPIRKQMHNNNRYLTSNVHIFNLSLREETTTSPNLQLKHKTCYELDTLRTKFSIS
jgi:hypothetical protein